MDVRHVGRDAAGLGGLPHPGFQKTSGSVWILSWLNRPRVDQLAKKLPPRIRERTL